MKTATAGFEKSKINTYFNLLKYYQNNQLFAEGANNDFLQTKQILEDNIGKIAPSTRILEIGCGQKFVQTILFNSENAVITGIDFDFIATKYNLKNLINIWRCNGFERFIKTFIRHILYDKKYYQILEDVYQKPLKWSNLDVRRMNACDLQFPDNHFDFIYSNAVFEHINDVDAAFSEMARVLKKNGCAYIGIHLYPSLSGGHHLDWAYPEEKPSKMVPPWDHLRENQFPTHVYLNRLKIEDYLSIINQYHDIKNIDYSFEGESLLTEELCNEIKGYSREDLLTRTISVLISKK